MNRAIMIGAVLLLGVTGACAEPRKLTRITADLIGAEPKSLSFSPDGSYVCFVFEDNPDNTAPRAELFCTGVEASGIADRIHAPLSTGAVTQVSYSADSEWVFYVAPDGGVTELFRARLDRSTLFEKVSQPATLQGDEILRYVLSPDGQFIVYTATRDGEAVVQSVDMDSPGTATTLSPTVVGNGLDATRPVFSPDSSRVLFVAAPIEGGSPLFSAALDGSDRVTLTSPNDRLVLTGALPEGEILFLPGTNDVIFMAGGDRDLFRVNAAGGSPLRLSEDMGSQFRRAGLGISPDGSIVCYADRPTTIWLLRCADTDVAESPRDYGSLVTAEFEFEFAPRGQFAFAPDNQTFLMAVNGNLRSVDANNPTSAIDNLVPDPGVIRFFVIPELGRVLYTANGDGELRIVAFDGSDRRLLFNDNTSADQDKAFLGYAPQADRILFRFDSNPFPMVANDLYSVDSDGTDPLALTVAGLSRPLEDVIEPALGSTPAIAADGQTIYFVDRNTFSTTSRRLRAVPASGGSGRFVQIVSPSNAANFYAVAPSPTEANTVLFASNIDNSARFDVFLDRLLEELFGDGFEASGP